ncbi:MAG: PAS domain S-box protein [Comamonadaceae bacterium]|jgi:PAS domain S-box-containing protein|nr:PAS domain S-box protein [Comamonadaceae bacterium]
MEAPRVPAAPPPALDDLGVYRSLFSAAADGLLLVDAEGQIVLANPAAAALLGYAPDELVGTAVDALVPDSIRPRHAAYRKAYGLAPRPRPMGTQMELVARRRDGSEVMVEIALSPLQSHGLPYVVAAIRDIGAYPRVKQALQRARHSEHLAQLGRMAVDERDPQQLLMRVPELAAQALEAEFSSVLLLEPDRLRLRVVSRFGDIASLPLGARLPACAGSAAGYVLVHGQPLVVADLAREDRFEVPQADLAAGMASLLAVPLSDRGRAMGVLCVRSRAAAHFGDDDTRFLQSLANLLATCLQRAQSEEALNHAQRLESVGQLTGGIAHDFNNLLTVIQGNLQVLEELPLLAGHEFGQQLVGAATRAARRGAELTGKLLAFSRRQVLQPTAVDLGALLQSLADMLRRTLDQRIAIRVELVGDATAPLAVLADPGQLESALLNIAINARDAMPDGGLLRFSAGPAGVLPAQVRREIDDPSAQDERFLRIAITDTGTGMPEAVRERAFEPFFTTKQAGRGTGLGLSTVYGFARQSRGAVAIESAPGAGTTISLYLPRPWDSQPARDEPLGEGGALLPGLKVLMVEDDAEVRAVARQFLHALGCEVTACASGEQALLLLTPEARFELLLTDIALGAGMRGTELASRAQQRLPGLAVLLMSGYSAELLEADQDAPPGWELLQKPYSRSELARAIARALSGGG